MAQLFTERQFTTLPIAVTSSSALRMERSTTVQSIPNVTNTIIAYNSTIFEVDETARLTPNISTGVVTVNEAGIYRITTGIGFAANSTNRRVLGIYVNASLVAQHAGDTAATALAYTISTLTKLAASDIIDVRAYQNSGGALDVDANARTHLTIEWAGPAT